MVCGLEVPSGVVGRVRRCRGMVLLLSYLDVLGGLLFQETPSARRVFWAGILMMLEMGVHL